MASISKPSTWSFSPTTIVVQSVYAEHPEKPVLLTVTRQIHHKLWPQYVWQPGAARCPGTGSRSHGSNMDIGTDNWAARSWRRKGSSTSSKAHNHLLKLNGVRQRHYCYLHTSFYFSSPSNIMDDNFSRHFDLYEPQLLAYFNITYPQNEKWNPWWSLHFSASDR